MDINTYIYVIERNGKRTRPAPPAVTCQHPVGRRHQLSSIYFPMGARVLGAAHTQKCVRTRGRATPAATGVRWLHSDMNRALSVTRA